MRRGLTAAGRWRGHPAVLALWLGATGIAGAADAAFTRLDAAGTALPATAPAAQWVCSRDERSGLVWELKTRDGGPRDGRWTYTPYDSNPATNGGYPGYKDASSGSCVRAVMPEGSCNTEAYVQAVNAMALCGYTDWRLPSVRELNAVAPQSSAAPAAAAGMMLPNTAEGWYWTGVEKVGVTAFSRVILLPPAAHPAFYDGSYMVLLVRGGGQG